jgi:methyltransferase family protein
MVTRHQFLTMLHDLLKPMVYLEVGVQYGLSMDLAVHSETIIGIDPLPLRHVQRPGEMIFSQVSDDYFAGRDPDFHPHIDLAFIDGSHLYEDALRDFLNIAPLCGPRSVVVFDDVLPYNVEMTSREPAPGDWTGDVWKIVYTLQSYLTYPVDQSQLGVRAMTVNTFPTGTLAVWGFEHLDTSPIAEVYEDLARYRPPPNHVLTSAVIPRIGAQEADFVIARIKEDLCVSQ